MFFRAVLIVSTVLFGCLAAAPAALAELLFSYSGTTRFGPMFVRPLLGEGGEPGVSGRNVRYHTRSFRVLGAGTTNCVVDSIQNGSFDGVVYVYRLAFDPQAPLNFVEGSRDGRLGIGSTSTGVFSVTANTPYVIVTADFSNRAAGAVGEFQNTISCSELGGAGPLSAEETDEASVREQQPPGNCPIGNQKVPGCTGPPTTPGRFQIVVTFSTPQNPTAVDQATLSPYGSSESALFSFFQPTNFEVLVKVLNFCNDPSADPSTRAWRVFAAGMTDVNVTVTVTDTAKPANPPIVIQNAHPNRFNFQERNFPTSSCT